MARVFYNGENNEKETMALAHSMTYRAYQTAMDSARKNGNQKLEAALEKSLRKIQKADHKTLQAVCTLQDGKGNPA